MVVAEVILLFQKILDYFPEQKLDYEIGLTLSD